MHACMQARSLGMCGAQAPRRRSAAAAAAPAMLTCRRRCSPPPAALPAAPSMPGTRPAAPAARVRPRRQAGPGRAPGAARPEGGRACTASPMRLLSTGARQGRAVDGLVVCGAPSGLCALAHRRLWGRAMSTPPFPARPGLCPHLTPARAPQPAPAISGHPGVPERGPCRSAPCRPRGAACPNHPARHHGVAFRGSMRQGDSTSLKSPGRRLAQARSAGGSFQDVSRSRAWTMGPLGASGSAMQLCIDRHLQPP